MADKMFENNQVSIIGEIVSDFEYSHEVYGEGFYMVEVSVNRLSNFVDYIPVMVSERLVDVRESCAGQFVYITGQFRSFNRHEERKNRLVLSVFAREFELVEELDGENASNQIFLDGYICKDSVYRKTPLGRRSRTFSSPSTAPTASPTIFRASAGGGTRGLQRDLRWEAMCRSGGASRVASM